MLYSNQGSTALSGLDTHTAFTGLDALHDSTMNPQLRSPICGTVLRILHKHHTSRRANLPIRGQIEPRLSKFPFVMGRISQERAVLISMVVEAVFYGVPFQIVAGFYVLMIFQASSRSCSVSLSG